MRFSNLFSRRQPAPVKFGERQLAFIKQVGRADVGSGMPACGNPAKAAAAMSLVSQEGVDAADALLWGDPRLAHSIYVLRHDHGQEIDMIRVGGRARYVWRTNGVDCTFYKH